MRAWKGAERMKDRGHLYPLRDGKFLLHVNGSFTVWPNRASATKYARDIAEIERLTKALPPREERRPLPRPDLGPPRYEVKPSITWGWTVTVFLNDVLAFDSWWRPRREWAHWKGSRELVRVLRRAARDEQRDVVKVGS